MALQPSGQISLDNIHVEAGGSTGTQASINDSDIRALIGKASGDQASFSDYYNATSASFVGHTKGTGTFEYLTGIPFTLPSTVQTGDLVVFSAMTARQRGSNTVIDGSYTDFNKLLDVRSSSGGNKTNRCVASFVYAGGSRNFKVRQTGSSTYEGEHASVTAMVFRGVSSMVDVDASASSGWAASSTSALSGTHSSTPTFWVHFGFAWDHGYSNKGNTLSSAPTGLTFATNQQVNASQYSHTNNSNYATATSASYNVGSFFASQNAVLQSNLYALS